MKVLLVLKFLYHCTSRLQHLQTKHNYYIIYFFINLDKFTNVELMI